jgi:hypothetical protein
MKKMSVFNIVTRSGIYFIIIIVGATIGYLLEGDIVQIIMLCAGVSFLVATLEEDFMTR